MLFRFIQKTFPPYARRLMLLSLFWNCCVYYGGRLLTASVPHYKLGTAFDAAFPLLPWTVSVYFLAFVFWGLNYCLVGSAEKESCFRFYLADFLARTVALLIFLLFPTTMDRIPITGDGIWCGLMRLLYTIDEPNMLFPSFHCLNSTLAVLALRGEKRVGKWYTLLSVFIALAICLSTLSTHQHVLADVYSGVALGILSYLLAGQKKLFPSYYALCEQVRS